MGTIASQITSLMSVYSAIYSDADQRKHQSSASLAFVRWIHRGPVNSPHKWPVTRKMFPFDDVIMWRARTRYTIYHDWWLYGRGKSQGISSRGVDLGSGKILIKAPEVFHPPSPSAQTDIIVVPGVPTTLWLYLIEEIYISVWNSHSAELWIL